MPRQARKADIERALRAAGFSPVRGGRGGHDKWRLGAHTVMVPRHTGVITTGTFGNVRRQAGNWSANKFWWYADGQPGPEPA